MIKTGAPKNAIRRSKEKQIPLFRADLVAFGLEFAFQSKVPLIYFLPPSFLSHLKMAVSWYDFMKNINHKHLFRIQKYIK